MPLKSLTLKGEQKRVLFLPPTEPLQIKGVAGSGKTTVALYRAKHLIDTQSNLFSDAKVAIFTYNKILVKYIAALAPKISGGYKENSDDIVPTKPLGLNVVITNFHKFAYRFLRDNGTNLQGRLVSLADQNSILNQVKSNLNSPTSNIISKNNEFFKEEISWMKGKYFQNKEEYMDAKRVGRGTNDRVSKADKELIWEVYTAYNQKLKEEKKVDFDDYAILCLEIINSRTVEPIFTHIVIDEAQDFSKAQILVLSALVSPETRSISIIADAAQRIYKSGFTWSEVGLNLRGARTIEFKKNYRNTSAIAQAALSLLEKENDKSEFTKVDTIHRDGAKPRLAQFGSFEEQLTYLDDEIDSIKAWVVEPTICVLHRNHGGLIKIKKYLDGRGYKTIILKDAEDAKFDDEYINICTLSSIKGLEFDFVFITDINEGIIPAYSGFSSDNDDFHVSTERRLLYTAMTRARDMLYLLSSASPSRYLGEIDPSLLEIVNSGTSQRVGFADDDLPF